MLNTVRERLTKYLRDKKISKSEFGRLCGVSNAYVTSLKKTIGSDVLRTIGLKFPDLNIEWLLTGEGQMLKPQGGHTVVTGDVSGNGNQIGVGNAHRTSPVSQPKAEDVETVETEEVELKETVILTPEIVNRPGLDIRKELEKDNLPVTTKYTQDIVPLHDAKVYLENDEMAPEIEANDPVLIRFMDSTAVVPGRMYFIDLYRGGVVRWVFPQEDGSLILRSTNTPDMHVPADSVKSISEVVAIWKRPKSMQSERITIMEEMRRRDDQMDRLIDLNKASGERENRLISLLERKN